MSRLLTISLFIKPCQERERVCSLKRCSISCDWQLLFVPWIYSFGECIYLPFFFLFCHHSGAQQDSAKHLAGHASVVTRPVFRHTQPSCFPLEFGRRHVVPLGRHRSGAVLCSAEAASGGWGAQAHPHSFWHSYTSFGESPARQEA